METRARESRLRLAVMCCLNIRDDDDEDTDDEDDNDEDDDDEDDDEPGGQAASEGGNVGDGTQVKAGLPMERFFFCLLIIDGRLSQ